MARVCSVTGKRRVSGSRIHRKGLTKKSGGIGTHVAKVTKRTFKPNVQRVPCPHGPTGRSKRVWVSAKALKAGKVEKA
jgi:large subunit ribosomal protein L28